MFAIRDLVPLGSDAVGKENKVRARPTHARREQAVEAEKISGVADGLRPTAIALRMAAGIDA